MMKTQIKERPTEPPLAYNIGCYFRMLFSDHEGASEAEDDAFYQAIDDLGEAIHAERDTPEWRMIMKSKELYTAAKALHEAARKMYYGLEGGRKESRQAAAHLRRILDAVEARP